MRVNIYAEEITNRVELVSTKVEETESMFYGVRFYLKTHGDMLPPRHPDDDSSAVTFWIKSSKGGFKAGDEGVLKTLLLGAVAALDHIISHRD